MSGQLRAELLKLRTTRMLPWLLLATLALVYGVIRTDAAGWGSAEVLGLFGSAVILLAAFVSIAGFDRPNIRYRIRQSNGGDSAREQLLRFIHAEHAGDAGLVYCLSRKKVEETGGGLKVSFNDDSVECDLMLVATGRGPLVAGLGLEAIGVDLDKRKGIAADEHPDLVLEAGDTVIFSAREIPGNERAVNRVQNLLARQQVRTITDRNAFVHVSGHPARDELAAMYEWTRPPLIVPIHGEKPRLVSSATIRSSMEVPRNFTAFCLYPILSPRARRICSRMRLGCLPPR